MRASFPLIDGQPVQRIAPSLDLIPDLVDLTGLCEDQEIVAGKLAREEARQRFDLASGPLIRAKTVMLSESNFILLITMHHSISDGTSTSIFTREFFYLVKFFTERNLPRLPDLPIQYTDFAVWQRESLNGGAQDRLVSYWRNQLEGVSVLDVPLDHPRNALGGGRGARDSVVLTSDLVDGLNELSQQTGVTLFMTFLAAFKALLYRYCGQSDIVVGTPSAGRYRKEVEKLIGLFMNMLVLRTIVEGKASFSELMLKEKDVCLGAYAHQEISFGRLVKELNPDRDLGKQPLFQVGFHLNNTPMSFQMQAQEGGALPKGLTYLDPSWTLFDLMMTIDPIITSKILGKGGMRCIVEYNRDLFDADNVSRLLQRYRAMLEAIVKSPGLLVSKIDFLTDNEKHQLLVEWNDTEGEYPSDRCIQLLFQEQVEKTPERIAVIYEEEHISFGTLNSRANKLAHFLKERGAGPDQRVGLCVDRGAEMILGMVAVLKAGSAYVPLDPAYPPQRLGLMIVDSEAKFLLTKKRYVGSPLEHHPATLRLDTDWGLIEPYCDDNPTSGARSENLAYVIYTSGSTGQPKGVAIEHRSTVTLLHWALDIFGPDKLAGVLASTSISFDLSVYEIFAPLSCGGTVILARTALDLPSLPAATQVGLINTVPSAMMELIRLKAVPASVQTVNLAGEPLQRRVVDQHYEIPTIAQVFNLYGPSEDTTYSTFALMDRHANNVPAVGGPIANTQVHLLGPQLELVLPGMRGEIYIAGDGLARGHLNRPELTAETFLPNPFSRDPGERLYKTGDRARYRASGSIEFVGRGDKQIKIRGFRMELGEIESALSGHPEIPDVAVVAVGEGSDKRLVAYLVPRNHTVPSSADLRAYLRDLLPPQTVPSIYVTLEEMPLTPNGKIDRRRLPAPDRSRREMVEGYVAPRSAVEESLERIWADLLNVDRVGIHDNFFDLGGHSLLATQVIARVRQTFQVEVSLRHMFESPTVAGFAAILAMTMASLQREIVSGIKKAPRDKPLPLSNAQERLWFLGELDPGSSAFNIPTALRLEGSLDVAALEQSLSDILRRHEVLRTTFKVEASRPVQVIHGPAALILSVVDLQCLNEAKRDAHVYHLASFEAARPFDLVAGPVLRARLLKLGQVEHVLLLTIHHIATDRWSTGVLIRELAELHESHAKGEKAVLPELEIQYADYAIWQREMLEGEGLRRQLAYWRQKLGGEQYPLELPLDRLRPAVQSDRGARQRVLIPADTTEGLRAVSRRAGVTLFMTLMAAFKALLGRYSGQERVVVGTPIAGRNYRETEGLIGFFVNSLALKTDLSGDPEFVQLLGREREVALEAYLNQDVPFERLVEELQPQRDLSRAPLFQVVFALQNTPLQSRSVAGLETSPVKMEIESVRYDLNLVMVEGQRALLGAVEYRTELFEASTIRRMMEHFA
ncbi:MAG TPA: amino acid adenylation domain-containing protein, partial [Blastocatellia bacterium]|nr:amino acid adenylation domain-containing protein [Blastocatellia bacterium]